MEQKQKLVELIMDSSLPQGLKANLLKYVSQSETVSDQVKEDVATVFDIYADLEQAVGENISGMATLEEQIVERLKMIDAEAAKRMEAISNELEPKVEEMKKEMQNLIAGTETGPVDSTSNQDGPSSTDMVKANLSADLPPVSTSSY